MHRSLWMRRVAAATALALAAAACGGGDTEEPADEPPADASSDESADEEEPAEEEPAEEEPAEEEVAVDRPERDDVLNLGYILPETGDLATLGPPQIQGVQLAVDDINAAGGVLGQDVTLATGDEAGDAGIVRQSAADQINSGVDGIVGAAASGMSQEIIQTLSDNQIVQCSAANTAPDFTDQENNDFYFRTVPPDQAVAPIIANTVVGDGYTNVAVLARADDYGDALKDLVIEGLEEQGVQIAADESYDPDASDFQSLVTTVTGADADAAVVIGFAESATIYRQLIEAGLGPEGLYGGDGVFGPALADQVGTEVTGLKVIGAAGGDEFNTRLNEQLGEDDQGNVIYGGQAYDCAIVIALAAAAPESADPVVFNDSVEDVTREGTECSSFEECIGLLDEGEDIDYQGVSGPIDLDRPDPTVGQYAVGEFVGDGELEIISSETVDLAEVE
jgi:branched-chain amino acid transport system substrate-binding protein